MGGRVKRLREAAGLSQSQLAKAARVPVNTIQQWEQDLRAPSFASAVKLADGLGVSLDELAGREPPRRKKGE
jgi:transcriptional regulator with XRE-family HTH domain